MDSRYSRVRGSTMCTAAPAVPKYTLFPESSRSWRGSCPWSTMSRAAFATTSSTSARGNSSRPSGLSRPPAAVTASTQLGMASDSPICSSASSAAAWIRCTPESSRGRYRPPIMPGRTAFSSSRNGAARSLCLAALPPMRRPLTAVSLMVPPAVARRRTVRVAGHAEYCRRTAGLLSTIRCEIFRGYVPPGSTVKCPGALDVLSRVGLYRW